MMYNDVKSGGYPEIKAFFDKQNWRFATTYANKCPHEYIVGGKQNGTDEEFLEVARYIWTNGIPIYYYSMLNNYVFCDDYYYWVMKADEDNPYTMVINRAKIDDYKISVRWKGLSK